MVPCPIEGKSQIRYPKSEKLRLVTDGGRSQTRNTPFGDGGRNFSLASPPLRREAGWGASFKYGGHVNSYSKYSADRIRRAALTISALCQTQVRFGEPRIGEKMQISCVPKKPLP